MFTLAFSLIRDSVILRTKTALYHAIFRTSGATVWSVARPQAPGVEQYCINGPQIVTGGALAGTGRPRVNRLLP